MLVIGIVGWKNSGKTRLMQKMIKYFSKKNFNVATIKHAHHNFDIDHKGTDSYLHRKSGANEIIISSSRRWAKIEEIKNRRELSLKNLVKEIKNADIVLVEGYKNENHKKIEVIRNKNKKNLYQSLNNVIAVVCNKELKIDIPVFKDTEYKKIGDFILSNINE